MLRCESTMDTWVPRAGGRLNIKTPSNQYGTPHYKKNTSWLPPLYNENPYTWKDSLLIETEPKYEGYWLEITAQWHELVITS